MAGPRPGVRRRGNLRRVRKTDTRTRKAGPPLLFLLIATALLASLFLSWRALAATDFLFPVWYDVADIGAHIDEFGPQNRYRDKFEETTQAARLAAFAAIGRAVRNDGRGLDSLTYVDASGRSRTLLRPPEIVHLQDVARLIGVLEPAGLGACVVFAALLVWLRRQPIVLPGLGRLLGGTVLFVVALVGLVWALGPRDVFYAFHEWVFPAGHQWFFYYQESLMSTLMKAPDLFAYIAAVLVALALVVLTFLLALATRLTNSVGRKTLRNQRK